MAAGEFYIEGDEIPKAKNKCAIACLKKSNCKFADFLSNESPFTCNLYVTCKNWNNLLANGHILYRKGKAIGTLYGLIRVLVFAHSECLYKFTV